MKTVYRLPFLDCLKGIAAQLIVLHHLAFYGPMSDVASELVPTLMGWLSEYGRVAVQVFLVVGGFLAAKGLAPEGRSTVQRPVSLIVRRYLKLVQPLSAALILAVVLSAVARGINPHDSISAAPGFWQAVAHLFLLQDIVGVEALSAGVWYIAIDLQLFALLALCLWVSGRARLPLMGVVVTLGAVSLLHFGRDTGWDTWGIYFFGSYALGALAWWAVVTRRGIVALLALIIVALAALALDFRLRPAVALTVAAALALAGRLGVMENWPRDPVTAFLGRISYSLFLVHFPVCLVVNAVFTHFFPESAWLNLLGFFLAWCASLFSAVLFHRYVESIPWLSRLPLGAFRIRLPMPRWLRRVTDSARG